MKFLTKIIKSLNLLSSPENTNTQMASSSDIVGSENALSTTLGSENELDKHPNGDMSGEGSENSPDNPDNPKLLERTARALKAYAYNPGNS